MSSTQQIHRLDSLPLDALHAAYVERVNFAIENGDDTRAAQFAAQYDAEVIALTGHVIDQPGYAPDRRDGRRTTAASWRRRSHRSGRHAA